MSYEPKLRRSGSLDLSGLQRPSAPKTIGAMGVAAAMMFLAGCSSVPDDGVVVEGADGENYVLPDGAERPTYRSREDCLADVEEQIRKLEAQGEQIEGDAESLCESSASYGSHYSSHSSSVLWLGPLLFASSRWNSPRVASWAPVTAGGFAAPGSTAQSDVAQKAPPGAKVGSRAPLKDGFGSTGKSGFGSTVKGKSGGSGSSGG